MSVRIYIVMFYRVSKPAPQLWSALNPPQLGLTQNYLPDIFDFVSFIHTSAGQGHLEYKPSMVTEGSKGWEFVSVKLLKKKKKDL